MAARAFCFVNSYIDSGLVPLSTFPPCGADDDFKIKLQELDLMWLRMPFALITQLLAASHPDLALVCHADDGLQIESRGLHLVWLRLPFPLLPFILSGRNSLSSLLLASQMTARRSNSGSWTSCGSARRSGFSSIA